MNERAADTPPATLPDLLAPALDVIFVGINPSLYSAERGHNFCGHVSHDNRLTQADFLCLKCGHSANADTNAAINILGRAG